MFKAVLVALAAVLIVDAAAWHGSVRTGALRQLTVSASDIAALDWRW